MPRVGLASVPQDPGSTPRLTATPVVPQRDATGAQLQQLGQGTQQAGMGVARIADHLQDEYDSTRTKERYALFEGAVGKELDDFEARVGKDAVGPYREEMLKRVEKTRRELEAGLDSAVQRRMFSEAVQRRMVDVEQRARRHEQNELRAYSMAETKTLGEVAMKAAGRSEPGSPEFRLQWNTAMNAAEELSTMSGWPVDSAQRAALRLAVTSGIHERQVDRLVKKGMPEQARAYLGAVPKHELLPDVATKLDDLVVQEGIRDESARLALRLAAEAREAGEPLQAFGNARLDALIAEGAPAALVDATRDRIDRADRSQREDAAVAAENAQVQAEQWLSEHLDEPVSAMPSGLLKAVRDAGKLGAINEFADNHRYSDDPRALAELEDMPLERIRRMTPAEFRVAYRDRLSPNNWRAAQALYASAIKSATNEQTDLLSLTQRVRSWARKNGVLGDHTRNLKEDEREALVTYAAEKLEQRINRFERVDLQGKRKASDEEIRKLMDEAALDKATETVGAVETKSIYAMTPEEEATAYVIADGEEVFTKKIPPAERAVIIEELEAAREPVSEQSIALRWVRSNAGRRDARAKAEQARAEQAAQRQRLRSIMDPNKPVFAPTAGTPWFDKYAPPGTPAREAWEAMQRR